MNLQETLQKSTSSNPYLNSNLVHGSLSYNSETIYMVMDQTNFSLNLYQSYKEVGKNPFLRILLKNSNFHKMEGIFLKNTFTLVETVIKERKSTSFFKSTSVETFFDSVVHPFVCFNQKDQEYWIFNLMNVFNSLAQKKYNSNQPTCPDLNGVEKQIEIQDKSTFQLGTDSPFAKIYPEYKK
jgi:hypothetical protein